VQDRQAGSSSGSSEMSHQEVYLLPIGGSPIYNVRLRMLGLGPIMVNNSLLDS